MDGYGLCVYAPRARMYIIVALLSFNSAIQHISHRWSIYTYIFGSTRGLDRGRGTGTLSRPPNAFVCINKYIKDFHEVHTYCGPVCACAIWMGAVVLTPAVYANHSQSQSTRLRSASTPKVGVCKDEIVTRRNEKTKNVHTKRRIYEFI